MNSTTRPRDLPAPDARHRARSRTDNHHEEDSVNSDIAYRRRRTIATTDTYADAEAVVDRLTDDGFAVEHVTIPVATCGSSSR